MGKTLTFEEELTILINKHSIENTSSTPDYILAAYLHDCIRAFGIAMVRRDKWWGKDENGNVGVTNG